MREIPAIILAAGQSTRFRAAGGASVTKLVAELAGRPLVRHVVEAALASRARPVFVVTGHAHEEVMAALAGLPVTEIRNPLYASGLASSLKAGIAALPAGARGALVLLGDMPLVSAALLDGLIDLFAMRPEVEAVVPVHAGERGNPVLVGRPLFAAVAGLAGDQGARKILAAARVAELAVAGDAASVDVDTPAVLADLEGQAAPDSAKSVSSSESPTRPVATIRAIASGPTGFENK
jgi:molybdenum cofactor cytidylyltransferase